MNLTVIRLLSEQQSFFSKFHASCEHWNQLKYEDVNPLISLFIDGYESGW